jgi:hypothetical protein
MQSSWERWYDARVGKWISEDPIGFAAGDANLSRYVGNQSTVAIDPTGLLIKGIDLLAKIALARAQVSAATTGLRGGAAAIQNQAAALLGQLMQNEARMAIAENFANLLNAGIIDIEQEAAVLDAIQNMRVANGGAMTNPDLVNRYIVNYVNTKTVDMIISGLEAKDIGETSEALSKYTKAEWIEKQRKTCEEKKWKNCEIHHVATDKHPKHFTPLLEAEFGKVGLSLQNVANLCLVCDIGDGRKHTGPNKDGYNQLILDVTKAINALPDRTNEEKKYLIQKFLIDTCKKLNRKGNGLRDAVTKDP